MFFLMVLNRGSKMNKENINNELMNEENFTAENINTKLIGRLKNNWRKRRVLVYEHPCDTSKVISVGYPFGGGDPIVCVERRSDWLRVLGLFPETATYD